MSILIVKSVQIRIERLAKGLRKQLRSSAGLTVAEKLNVLNAQHESLQKDLKYQSDYLTTAEIQVSGAHGCLRQHFEQHVSSNGLRDVQVFLWNTRYS